MMLLPTSAEILFECHAARTDAKEYRARVAVSLPEIAKHCADSRVMIAQSRAIIAEMDGSSPSK